MTKQTGLSKFFKNQAELAGLLAGGIATRAARIKAHRIWHGTGKPNTQEISLISSATGGELDANYFHGITKPKRTRK